MSERLRTIADQLGSRPEDRALEIVDADTAEFIVGELERLDLGHRRCDLAFAVRVGLFHREPERARGLAERWLAPGGRVLAFSDPPVRRARKPSLRRAAPGR